jgi:pimeloyl-ACP methyl ester carboxylesterase
VDNAHRRRQLWGRIRLLWITVGLSATAIFVVWSLVAYRASGIAHAAADADAVVDVQYRDGVWSFVPRASQSPTRPALVFFPGALVDPIAYAPLLRAVATGGFPAYMIELPRRGAFGGADDPEVLARLSRLLAVRGRDDRWLVAGHSRGAVVACQVAAARRTGLAGLILIGTSHPRDVDLSTLTIAVTKIAGTHDGLASRDEVEGNRRLLPASTRWIWIEGGNHSQFGWYGFQPGDWRATIAPADQRAAMIAAVLDALTQAARVGPAS